MNQTRTRTLIWALLFSFVWVMTSCADESPLPKRQVDVLAPLTKALIGPNQIKELSQGNVAGEKIKAFPEIPFPVAVPDSNWGDTLLYTGDFSAAYDILAYNDVEVTVKIINNYPIGVKKGTRLVLKNKNNQTIFNHSLSDDLDPNETYEFIETSQNGVFTDTFQVYAENLQTKASNGPVLLDSTGYFAFTMDISSIDIRYVTLYTDTTYHVDEVVEFDLSTGDDFNAEDAQGKVIVYLQNDLPMNAYAQVYFLNQDSVITDSLFAAGTASFPGVPVDANGVPTSENVEQKYEIVYDKQRFQNVIDSKIVRFVAEGNTAENYNVVPGIGKTVYFGEGVRLKFQIVGDFSGQVK